MKDEDIEHIKLADWIRSRPDIQPYAWHFANQRKCSLMEGKKLKRMMVRRGVSDFFICCPRGGFSGLWLELKVGLNKPTKEQREFIALMNSQRYYALWVVGFEAARDVILRYLEM